MTFELKFKTDNAAFVDDRHSAAEVARILRETANKVEAGQECNVVYDSNGNTVGSWDFDNDEEPEDGGDDNDT